MEFFALSFDKDAKAYQQWMAQNRQQFIGATFARANVNSANWRTTLNSFKAALPGFYIVGRDGNVVVGYSAFMPEWVENSNGVSADQRLCIGLRAAGVPFWDAHQSPSDPPSLTETAK